MDGTDLWGLWEMEESRNMAGVWLGQQGRSFLDTENEGENRFREERL